MAQRDRYRRAWSHDIQVIGGLTAVSLGLAAVLIIAILAVIFVRNDAAQVAIVAGSAFTVIGTLVGAYFGMKIGTDQTKAAREQTDRVTKVNPVVVLKDDRGLNHNDYIVAAVNSKKATPELEQALGALSAKLTQEELLRMNKETQIDRKPVDKVAQDFVG